jgi:hypothetical protein
LTLVFQRFVELSLSLYDPDEPVSFSDVGLFQKFCQKLAPQEAFMALVWAAVGELMATPAGQCVSLALLRVCVGDGRAFFAEDSWTVSWRFAKRGWNPAGLHRELACELVDAFVRAFPGEAGDYMEQLARAVKGFRRSPPHCATARTTMTFSRTSGRW